MQTYIIESQGYYKIGKTSALENRLANYHTHNPCFKLLLVIDGDHESLFLNKYKNKRYKGEWFALSKEEIESIINFDKSVIESLEDYDHLNITKLSIQLIDFISGEIINTYDSLEDAEKDTGIKKKTIRELFLKLRLFVFLNKRKITFKR